MTLLQNMERPRWRRAAEVAAGEGACGADSLGPEWAEALTRTRGEAEDLHFRMNADRQSARAKARRGD